MQQLFAEAKSFAVFPIKTFYLPLPADAKETIQVSVGVSSRNFKKAVDRNRIKRLLRECYRLNKLSLHSLVKEKDKPVAVFFLYIGKELPVFAELETKMKTVLSKLEANLA